MNTLFDISIILTHATIHHIDKPHLAILNYIEFHKKVF